MKAIASNYDKAYSFKVLFYIVLLCLKDIADFRGGKKLSARRIRLIAKYCITFIGLVNSS